VALKHLCDSIQRGSAPVYLADGDEPTASVLGQSCQRPGGGFDAKRMRAHVGPVPTKGRIRGQEVVINSTGTGTLGRVALVPMLPPDRPVFADTHVTILAVDRRRCDPRFIAYTLGLRAVARFADEALSVGSTKQRELNATAIATHRIHCPEAEAQRKIADFLDGECERIAVAQDRLDRLAAAAAEPALALAEHAWADHPPGRIGYAFEVQLGKMLYEDRIDHATARPYLRIANVYWDRFALDDVKAMNFAGAEAALYALRPGDLLVCEGRGLGRSAVWEGQISPCYFQKALNRVRPHGLGSTRWVMWCLRVLNRRGAFEGDAPGVPHLTAEQLRGTRIPLPSPEVQHRLAAEIDDAARRGRRLATVAAATRARLAEYRDALITEAVTGRLDAATSDGELTERLDAAVDGAHR
jgi:type I restriction enzyme S subunit